MPTQEAGKETNIKKWLIKHGKPGSTDQERVTSERTMLYVSTKKTFENSKDNQLWGSDALSVLPITFALIYNHDYQ